MFEHNYRNELIQRHLRLDGSKLEGARGGTWLHHMSNSRGTTPT